MSYRAALSSIGEAVLVADRDGRVSFMNPAARTITGWDGQCMGKEIPQILRLVDETTRRPIEDACRRAMRDGQAGEKIDHAVLIRRDGTEVFVEGSATPLQNEGGDVDGVVLVFRDITERKAKEKQTEMLNAGSLMRYQEQLRAMASELTLTEQRERRRLASELHDSLAQTLVACRLHAGLLSKGVSDVKRAQLVKQLDEMLKDSISYTRSLIADLCPVVLYEFGFEAAVCWLAERMKRYDLTVAVRINTPEASLADDQAVLLYQAVRELLMNVLKHAQVDEAEIEIARRNGDLEIIVSDRGVGFASDPSARPHEMGHLGLFSIEERLKTLGGRFTMTSSPGSGSQAVLRIPLQEETMEEQRVTRNVSSAPNVYADVVALQGS